MLSNNPRVFKCQMIQNPAFYVSARAICSGQGDWQWPGKACADGTSGEGSIRMLFCPPYLGRLIANLSQE